MLVAYGVGHKLGCRTPLIAYREDLLEKRVMGIAYAHSGDILARGEKGKATGRFDSSRKKLIWQFQQMAKFGGIADGGLHGIAPRSLLARWQGAGIDGITCNWHK